MNVRITAYGTSFSVSQGLMMLYIDQYCNSAAAEKCYCFLNFEAKNPHHIWSRSVGFSLAGLLLADALFTCGCHC